MEIAENIARAINEKNIIKYVQCFSSEARGYNLKDEKLEFSNTKELESLLIDLFRVNPNLHAKIEKIVSSDSHYVFRLLLKDFLCGAKADVVWNCQLVEGKIKKLCFF